jgi:hypothetical protein
MIGWNSDMEDEQGEKLGSCVRVDAAGNLTIVGGTGAYDGIIGTVGSTPVEQRARFRYETDYRLD